VKVNGYDAFIGALDASKSKSAVSLIAVLEKGSGVYLFKGEGAQGTDIDAFTKAFRATVESFRDMTTSDLRTANDQRITLVEAKPGDTYASLGAKSSIKSYPEETLRLLNGDYPHGEPRAGDMVKIVQ
jgi:predicted Zn-dependent protease